MNSFLATATAVVVGALGAFLLGYKLLVWRPPHSGTKTADDLRIHRAVRSFIPALVGGALGAAWAFRLRPGANPDFQTPLMGALVGAFVVLYLVMLVSVPSHATAIVNVRAISDIEEEAARAGHRPPYVWPMDVSVRRLGSITWVINGDRDLPRATKARIRFSGPAPSGKKPNYFKGNPFGNRMFDVDIPVGHPGVIAAGPVINSGAFPYVVEILDAGGTVILQTDPMADIPRG